MNVLVVFPTPPFREMKATGKTIVLVTHDMTTVQSLCHRAMLLHDGELRYIGEPEDAARVGRRSVAALSTASMMA